QILGRVYAVLSDEKLRAEYDETGTVDEEGSTTQGEQDWLEYWRLLFKKITVKDIEEYEKKYRDSAEELADVKAAYMDFKGNMDKIMESVMCAKHTDEPRIRKIIEQAIDSGELPAYNSFVKESKQKRMARRRKAEREAEEAKKVKEDMGLSGDDDLQALIQSRSKDREREMNNFFAHLEAKYGNTTKKGAKKTVAKKKKT
ncbi:DnaJ subfamily C member 9, partial [Acanthisitta chloris]